MSIKPEYRGDYYVAVISVNNSYSLQLALSREDLERRLNIMVENVRGNVCSKHLGIGPVYFKELSDQVMELNKAIIRTI